MIPRILNFLMTAPPEDFNFRQRKALEDAKSSELSKALKWEPQAIQVIKEKIAHYKKTGNVRKLAIYESKLKGAYSVIGKLNKLKRFFKI